MPNWKPDCLKASAATFNQYNSGSHHHYHHNGSRSADPTENGSVSNESSTLKLHHQILNNNGNSHSSPDTSSKHSYNRSYRSESAHHTPINSNTPINNHLSEPAATGASTTGTLTKHSHSSSSSSSNNTNGSSHNKKSTADLTNPSSSLSSSHKALSFQNASSKGSTHKGHSVCELSRSSGSQFGLTIAGGTDKDSRPRICDLKPGSIAHRSDELQIGDMLISINGVKTQGLKHEEIIDLIKNAGEALCLEYEYNLPPWPIHPHQAVRSQTVHIQLEKENSSYGFTIRGGYNEDKLKSRPLIVTNIRAGGSADREGTLKIGDRIVAINGINLMNATLQDAYYIIKQCKGLTLFLVEYDSAIVDSIKNSNGPLLIEIEKSPGSSIGIKLMMAKSPVTGKSQILVESVKQASIADRCGAIYVGDQILSIDDISFEHVTLAEANQILKNCVGEFTRVEILPLSQMVNNNGGTVKNNNLQQNQKISNMELLSSRKFAKLLNGNFHFNYNNPLSNASEICSLTSNSDMTLGSGGQTMSQNESSRRDAAYSSLLLKLIKSNSKNRMISGQESTTSLNLNMINGKSGSASQRNLFNLLSLSNQNHQNIINSTSSSSSNASNNNNNHYAKCSRIRTNSISSLSSCNASLSSNQVSHTDTVEVSLKSDESIGASSGSFGFTLQGAGIIVSSSHMNDSLQTNLPAYPVVGYIEPNSPAEKCGLMQVGDRILAVNGRSLEGVSLEEARQIIRESGSNLKLEIEFDVADTILLSSGTFQVKLLKKNMDLGICVAYPKLFKAENFPFISDIKKGSIAFRSGMLQMGDQILYINNMSLKNRPLNEVNQLLRINEEVVKLKVKKDEHYAEENLDDKVVVYTVELQRNGGPLGITISGSDDLFEPLHVSGLTEGGLAERTNAIHIGDTILAINNVSLRGKSLTEAIELLKSSDDIVTLKISRKLDLVQQQQHHKLNGPGPANVKTSLSYLAAKNGDNDDNNHNGEINEYNTNSRKKLTNGTKTPFPADMSQHFAMFKQQGNGAPTNTSTLTKQSVSSSNDAKKKALSMDSINAVERELDEVLKDLELNSQDLAEQLNENGMQQHHASHHTNSIEVPITILKSEKPSVNKWTAAKSQTPEYMNSSNGSNSKYYIEEDIANRKQQRNNVVSTYEMCNECFDNSTSLVMNGNGVGEHKCSAHANKHLSNSKPNVSSSLYNHLMNSASLSMNGSASMRQHNSFSNQDLTNGNHHNSNGVNNNASMDGPFSLNNNRSRSVLAQINESVTNDNNNKLVQGGGSSHQGSSYSYLRSNSGNNRLNILNGGSGANTNNSNNNSNGFNGNVISQKIVAIGMSPVNGSTSSPRTQSPSPKLTEYKSENKLDKLPPVPPSWSTSASYRRRNPGFQSQPFLQQSANRLKKFNVGGNMAPQMNRNDFQNEDSHANNDSPKPAHYQNELVINEGGNSSNNSSTSSTENEPISNSSEDSRKLSARLELMNGKSQFIKNTYDNIEDGGDKSTTTGTTDELLEQIDDKVEVTINKDFKFKDFGFTVADSVFGQGVYVNKVRGGSQAEQNLYLKTNTKIYKINNFDCTKLDSNQVSKILQNEQTINNSIKLVVSKKPKNVALSDLVNSTSEHRNSNGSNWDIQNNSLGANSSRATAL